MSVDDDRSQTSSNVLTMTPWSDENNTKIVEGAEHAVKSAVGGIRSYLVLAVDGGGTIHNSWSRDSRYALVGAVQAWLHHHYNADVLDVDNEGKP